MELVWTEIYSFNGDDKIICINYDSDNVESHDVDKDELNEVKRIAYNQACNEIQEYFLANPTQQTYPLYIQDKDIKLYKMFKKFEGKSK